MQLKNDSERRAVNDSNDIISRVFFPNAYDPEIDKNKTNLTIYFVVGGVYYNRNIVFGQRVPPGDSNLNLSMSFLNS